MTQRVLVLCTGNSCRSIMAEALFNQLGAGRIEAVSAGSHPAGYVHPKSLETLQRHGIGYNQPRSKSWDEFAGQKFDLVVTVCDAAAAESCPVFLGAANKLHWSTPDPAKAVGSEQEVTTSFDHAFNLLKEQIEAYLLDCPERQCLSKLIGLTKRLLQKHSSFKRNEHIERLITYFMFKQLDHAISVIRLDPSADVILIARTMIEGVLNLEWVLKEREKRASSWFDYSCIYNYELLERKITNGSSVSEGDKQSVQSEYEAKGQEFLTRKTHRPHDNFRCGVSLRALAEKDWADFYECYQFFSDWVHWGSQSLDNMFSDNGAEISYYEADHLYRKPALLVAFASLLNVVATANQHFSLGFDNELTELSNSLIKLCET